MIEIRGSYRYATLESLEQAIAAVHEQLDDDEPEQLTVDWLRLFVRFGTTLHVNATLPFGAYRVLSGGVVDALACGAIEGAVEARRSGRIVDFFPSGD